MKTITLPLEEYNKLLDVETECKNEISRVQKEHNKHLADNLVCIFEIKQAWYDEKPTYKILWGEEEEMIQNLKKFIRKMSILDFIKLKMVNKGENNR